MGKYLNPGNEGFVEITSGYYVDKTGLIELVNKTINKPEKLICISRPRRFGKSFAVDMLCAYYDCSCDSHELFDKYSIKNSDTYEQYINQFNVILIDVTGFISEVKRSTGKTKISDVPNMIVTDLKNDLIKECPELSDKTKLDDCLLYYVKKQTEK